MADDRITVRIHVSAVDHASVLQEALQAWVGDVDVERSSFASHAGPTMLTLSVNLHRKADLRKAWSGLSSEALSCLLEDLAGRLDDEGAMHFRVGLDDLVAGRVELAPPGSPRSAKVRCKVAVYPGQTAEGRLREVTEAALQ